MQSDINAVWQTFVRAADYLGSFLVIFSTFFFSFTVAGMLLFGPELRGFHYIYAATISMLQGLLGKVKYVQLMRVQPVISLYFTAFFLWLILVVRHLPACPPACVCLCLPACVLACWLMRLPVCCLAYLPVSLFAHLLLSHSRQARLAVWLLCVSFHLECFCDVRFAAGANQYVLEYHEHCVPSQRCPQRQTSRGSSVCNR